MHEAAVLTQVQVPLVILFVQTFGADFFQQHVVALFALAAADDLADARRQHVHRADCLAVLIEPHVEGLNVRRVVGDGDGLFENFLGQIALVLALQIGAPVRGEFPVAPGFFQQSDRFRVGDVLEGAAVALRARDAGVR